MRLKLNSSVIICGNNLFQIDDIIRLLSHIVDVIRISNTALTIVQIHERLLHNGHVDPDDLVERIREALYVGMMQLVIQKVGDRYRLYRNRRSPFTTSVSIT